MKKLIFGVGINDAEYVVRPSDRSASAICPIYQAWYAMLQRCYSKKFQEKRPTYVECLVNGDWHLFSNFRAWMLSKDWQGKQLDKDIIFIGNKIYAPETCTFVDGMTNSFILDNQSSENSSLIGACWNKRDKVYSARCRNPFTKKREHLGLFDCEIEAHLAWKKRKHELALQLANLQTDDRVAAALRTRYQTTTIQRTLSE
jgi:hypothetical protein